MSRILPALLCAFLLACGNGERPRSTPAPQVSSRPSLRLVLISDLQGHLEPCGCQSRPLGGLDRLATALKRLRAEGLPTLAIAAGDLLQAPGGTHGADHTLAAQQDAWRVSTLLDVLRGLELQGVLPTNADVALTAADPALTTALTTLGATSWVAADTEITGRVLSADGIKIGAIGIRVDTDSLDALRPRVEDLARQQRAEGAVVVLTIVLGDRRSATRIARFDGVDFALSAGIDLPAPSPPQSVGQGFALTAGRHGEGLLVVDLYRVDGGPWHDASPWSRRRQQEGIDASIAELRDRIASWERAGNVDAQALQQQRQRLRTLEAERNAPTSNASGNRFVAEWREIGPELVRDPGIDGLINAYDQRVNQHNRVAFADVRAPPVPAGQPHFAGSAACQSCHQKAYAWWTGHAHGRAYATLQELNKEFNLSCVGCHVTGYNEPGGSTVVHNEGLINVGCESCHGPGSAHVEDPDEEPYTVRKVVAESVCVTCHNPEHSDKFEYTNYRAKLLVPGHGQPVTPSATPTAGTP